VTMLRAIAREAPLRSFLRAVAKISYNLAPRASFDFAAHFDAIPYTQYAVGMQTAVRYAQLFGANGFTAIEFGVAGGNGLLAMARHAEALTRKTGIKIEVVGFDAGAGLPATRGWQDAPWVWRQGDYPLDATKLERRLEGKARFLIGLIEETFPRWLTERRNDLPMGFISIDIDYYSSSRAILDILSTCSAEALLPITEVYLDDILCFGVPRCAGELAAVREFNEAQMMRQFDREDWIAEWRPFCEKLWLKRLYSLYAFDHPRMHVPPPRPSERLDLLGR
jgi:hypothetical protein